MCQGIAGRGGAGRRGYIPCGRVRCRTGKKRRSSNCVYLHIISIYPSMYPPLPSLPPHTSLGFRGSPIFGFPFLPISQPHPRSTFTTFGVTAAVSGTLTKMNDLCTAYASASSVHTPIRPPSARTHNYGDQEGNTHSHSSPLPPSRVRQPQLQKQAYSESPPRAARPPSTASRRPRPRPPTARCAPRLGSARRGSRTGSRARRARGIRRARSSRILWTAL